MIGKIVLFLELKKTRNRFKYEMIEKSVTIKSDLFIKKPKDTHNMVLRYKKYITQINRFLIE